VTRWLRLVIPPGRLAGLWLLGWLPVGLLAGLFWFAAGELPPADVARPLIVTGGSVTVLYAALRAFQFHPAFRPGYANWLARAPWTPDRPLPFGPVHLVWQDAFVIAVLVFPAVLLGEAGLLLQVAAAAYLTALATVLVVTQTRPFAYLIGFGLGGLALLANQPLPYFAAASIVYAVGMLGFRRSLDKLPWHLGPALGGRAKPSDEVGWPHNRLGPKPPSPGLSRWEAVALGLLAGWLLYAINLWADSWPGPHGGEPALMALVLGLGTAIGVIARLLVYIPGYLPPIGLAGRWATRRLVIPGYDEVFLAPFMAVLLAAALPTALADAGLSGPAGSGLTLAAVVAVLVGVGPRLREWQLTAPCRITRLPTDKGGGQPGRAQA
jgi:hypothetical protein